MPALKSLTIEWLGNYDLHLPPVFLTGAPLLTCVDMVSNYHDVELPCAQITEYTWFRGKHDFAVCFHRTLRKMSKLATLALFGVLPDDWDHPPRSFCWNS